MRDRADRPLIGWQFWLLLAGAIAATALSVAATGFVFAVGNNVFHIPYVLRYELLPQFQSDAFYQSLDKFTSLVWPVIRRLSDQDNVEQVFWVAHLLSRLSALCALGWFFCKQGLASTGAVTAAMLVAAASPWLMGVSAVGGHGLLLHYFTHSELTWAPVVVALVAAQGGRLRLAMLCAGVTFSINAFVGIWLVAILGTTVLAHPAQRRDFKLLGRSALAFALGSLPVAIWIAMAIGKDGGFPAYSYIEYIRSYYPAHFLIEAAPPYALRNLALMVLCGFCAAQLSRTRAFWLAVLCACVVLFAVAVVLPYVLDQRFVFNLHLLRSAGVLQFLSIVLAIAASMRILMAPAEVMGTRFLAGLAAMFLIAGPPEPLHLAFSTLCLALLATRGARWPQWLCGPVARSAGLVGWLAVAFFAFELLYVGASAHWGARTTAAIILWGLLRKPRLRFVPVLLGLLAVLSAGKVTMQRMELAAQSAARHGREVDQLIQWVRESPATGPFLLPVGSSYDNELYTFQLRTRKPVWVDWKQGAAVMWQPSFYWQWQSRMVDVVNLRAPEDFAAYARRQSIQHIVLPSLVGQCPDAMRVDYRNDAFSVCSAP